MHIEFINKVIIALIDFRVLRSGSALARETIMAKTKPQTLKNCILL